MVDMVVVVVVRLVVVVVDWAGFSVILSSGELSSQSPNSLHSVVSVLGFSSQSPNSGSHFKEISWQSPNSLHSLVLVVIVAGLGMTPSPIMETRRRGFMVSQLERLGQTEHCSLLGLVYKPW